MAWASIAAGCTVYPSAVPAEPAYDTDVRPIFLAHCARCHGNGPDGGSLNNALFGNTGVTSQATGPCLTQYGDNPNSLGCPKGAGSAKTQTLSYPEEIVTYIHATDAVKEMPPAPAARLNDWELEVVDTWAAETPMPICSKSSNPDPAILCP